jgi:hypothetical protein
MTDEQHNKYIAYAFAAHGGFQMLMLLFVGAVFFAVTSLDPSGPPPEFFLIIFGFVSFFYMLFAAPSFIAAYAMLKKKPWARIAGIVAAALSAMNVPVGTGAAVYSLWFFCGENWRSVYAVADPDDRRVSRLASAKQDQWRSNIKEDDPAYVHRTPPPPDWR